MTDPDEIDEIDALAAQAAEAAQWARENSRSPDVIAALSSSEIWAKNLKEKKNKK